MRTALDSYTTFHNGVSWIVTKVKDMPQYATEDEALEANPPHPFQAFEVIDEAEKQFVNITRIEELRERASLALAMAQETDRQVARLVGKIIMIDMPFDDGTFTDDVKAIAATLDSYQAAIKR